MIKKSSYSPLIEVIYIMEAGQLTNKFREEVENSISYGLVKYFYITYSNALMTEGGHCSYVLVAKTKESQVVLKRINYISNISDKYVISIIGKSGLIWGGWHTERIYTNVTIKRLSGILKIVK